MKVLRTRVRFPTSPPKAFYPYLTRKDRIELNRMLLMGMHWLRRGKIAERTTGQATDLISAKPVNANDDVYDMALAA